MPEHREQRRQNEPKLEDGRQAVVAGMAEINAMRQVSDHSIAKGTAESAELKRVQAELVRPCPFSRVPSSSSRSSQTEIVQSNRNQAIETSRLKDQIIRSPEKLRTTIADLGVTLLKEQDSLRGFEAKERQMTTKITNLAKYEVVSAFPQRAQLER